MGRGAVRRPGAVHGRGAEMSRAYCLRHERGKRMEGKAMKTMRDERGSLEAVLAGFALLVAAGIVATTAAIIGVGYGTRAAVKATQRGLEAEKAQIAACRSEVEPISEKCRKLLNRLERELEVESWPTRKDPEATSR